MQMSNPSKKMFIVEKFWFVSFATDDASGRIIIPSMKKYFSVYDAEKHIKAKIGINVVITFYKESCKEAYEELS